MYPLWKNRLKFTQLLNETASAHFSSGLTLAKTKQERKRPGGGGRGGGGEGARHRAARGEEEGERDERHNLVTGKRAASSECDFESE